VLLVIFTEPRENEPRFVYSLESDLADEAELAFPPVFVLLGGICAFDNTNEKALVPITILDVGHNHLAIASITVITVDVNPQKLIAGLDTRYSHGVGALAFHGSKTKDPLGVGILYHKALN